MSEQRDALPVIEAEGQLLGVIDAVGLERRARLQQGRVDRGSAGKTAVSVAVHDSLEHAVQATSGRDEDGVSVIDQQRRPVGWLAHRDVLRAYREHLNELTPTRTQQEQGATLSTSAVAAVSSVTDRPRPYHHPSTQTRTPT